MSDNITPQILAQIFEILPEEMEEAEMYALIMTMLDNYDVPMEGRQSIITSMVEYHLELQQARRTVQ